MNQLAMRRMARPETPWTADRALMGPDYFEILIDGAPLWEHLVAAARANGFESVESDRGPLFYFTPEQDEDEVGFHNYICPAGWTRSEWQREWMSWLLLENQSTLPEHRIPLLVCGVCACCDATTVRAERSGPVIRWYSFQEFDWDFERLRLPELYGGLEFNFDAEPYREAFAPVLAALPVDHRE